jgi:hypothetical protein
MSAPEAKPQTKLVSVAFVDSIPFGNESMSVQIGRNCDSITPARMEADGSAVAIDKNQRADGLLIRQRRHDRVRNVFVVDQCFVPWSNIRGLQYGE